MRNKSRIKPQHRRQRHSFLWTLQFYVFFFFLNLLLYLNYYHMRVELFVKCNNFSNNLHFDAGCTGFMFWVCNFYVYVTYLIFKHVTSTGFVPFFSFLNWCIQNSYTGDHCNALQSYQRSLAVYFLRLLKIRSVCTCYAHMVQCCSLYAVSIVLLE